MKRNNIIVIFSSLPMILSSAAFADTDTTSFTVQATVAKACAMAIPTLDFGAYDPTASSNTNGQTDISVTCTTNTGYTIALDVGNGSSATFANRKMTLSSTLDYCLYTNPGRTTVWGDGAGGSSTVAGTGNGNAQVVPIYGEVFAGQYVPPGTYQDTITATITF